MNAGSNAVEEPSAGDASVTATPARFAWQVAWTLLARVVMAGNSLAAGIVVARWLGARGLGTLAVINVTVALTTQLGSLGLPSANTYFVARERKSLRTAAVNSLVFALGVGLALAVGATALAALMPGIFGGATISLVALAAAAIPFQLITLLGLNLFLATGRVARFNLLDLVGQSFVFVNALVALVILSSGLTLLVALNTATTMALSLVVVWMVWRFVRGDAEAAGGAWRVSRELFRRMLGYALRVHLQTAASLLLFRVDLLVVGYFRGEAEAGVYAVASQVSLLLMLLPAVVSTLLFPRLAEARDETGALACRVTRQTTFVMLCVSAAAVPAVFALPLLYGRQFADAPVQALILLPGVLLVSLGGVLAQHFSGTGLPLALPLFWTSALVLNTALNLALVPAYGARAAALSSSVSYALVCALIAFYFRRRTGHTLATAFVPRLDELRGLRFKSYE